MEGHWKENSGVTPVPHSGGGNNLAAYIPRLQVLLKKRGKNVFREAEPLRCGALAQFLGR